MDFWGTVLVVFRRWYVFLPVFALSVAAAAGVYSTVPTTYVSSAVLILTTPATGGSLPANPDIPNGLSNPMLHFDHGLSVSASILIAAMGTPDMAAELGAAAGTGATFKVTNGGSNLESLATGPFLFVEGEGTTAADAQDMVRRVLARARTELEHRQQAVRAPRATYITTYEAVPPTTPVAQRGRRLRAVAAAAGLGLMASLWACFAVESVLHRRAARVRPPAVRPPAVRPPVRPSAVHPPVRPTDVHPPAADPPAVHPPASPPVTRPPAEG
ncbi:hypothetical protein FHS43_000351 [Streptosporangium becharense]|uniref:Capsular polysaccharide biosynthesis protein n=1 Tax=Streptosporangium becharense TaxID=1816182 RepID=A0A7W9IGH8_9ACTN|nr:hypothetical protein [Streptosporangium becharense]MBB2909105.1 hypothetical protein [Streptosporangium becharense]MBB5819876.1 hypothetical protein [Streptosporangium becharense]